MAIHTQQSVSGFFGSVPQLSYTAKGDAWFYTAIGVEARRRAEDEFYASPDPDMGELGS
ncbi:hypothetical protein [Sinomonas terrae]|uniref:Uncharacterized protein n=1 Tax=Sinomonas terrae TaxID=2908838 RepID=A0ABS9U3E8_9MICC|nr:hypothetical protein [Sinomonas terrae]MCH6471231.1 hypothetical protein [Sinomonas terrae]